MHIPCWDGVGLRLRLNAGSTTHQNLTHVCPFVREVHFFFQNMFPGVHHEIGEPFISFYFLAMLVGLR